MAIDTILQAHTDQVSPALAKDGATADALSPAFMIMSPQQIERFCLEHPNVSAMTASMKGILKKEKINRFGEFKKFIL